MVVKSRWLTSFALIFNTETHILTEEVLGSFDVIRMSFFERSFETNFIIDFNLNEMGILASTFFEPSSSAAMTNIVDVAYFEFSFSLVI